MPTPSRAVRALAAVAGSLVLYACGNDAPPEPPPPVSETVFGDAVGTMDRARAVQDVTQAQKQALDAAIQQSEGSAEAR